MRRILILAAPLVIAAALPAAGAVPAARDADAAAARADLSGVPALELALPDARALAREDAERRARGLPYRFAVPEDVALTPDNSGSWSEDGGRRVWRLRVATPGAVSLNLGFARFDLPPSARLSVYPAGDPGAGLAWDLEDVAPHGELWTPVLPTDELVVELAVAAGERHLVELELGTVGRGYRGFRSDPAGKAGTCNIDVVCPQGDPWREEIRSVGGVSLGGSVFCTGAMINNTAHDGRPLFLTADHCGIWSGNSASVVIYWNFESAACGDQGGGSLSQSQAGSTVLAHWSGTDFTLLELDDAPDAAFDVRWAGWDRRDRNNLASVAIHHPSGDEKSISFDDDPTTVTSYTGTAVPGDGSHLRIGAWDEGTTEAGSSGSPLFNEAHRITGQLHGGYASCNNPGESDWYGRLAVSWDGSGEAGGRLSDHLDPLGVGLPYLHMLGTQLELYPAAIAEFTGSRGGPFTPSGEVFSLQNPGAASRPYAVEGAGGTWFRIVDGTGDVPAGGNAEFRIELTAAADDLPPGAHAAQAPILAGAGGDTIYVVDVVLTVSGSGLVLDPAQAAAFAGRLGGPFAPAERAYTLENFGTSSESFAFDAVEDAWYEVVGEPGVVPAGGSAAFSVRLTAAAAGLGVGSHGGRVRVLDAPGGALLHTVEVLLDVEPRTVLSLDAVAPNPSRGLMAIHYTAGTDRPVTARVYDLRGVKVADLGTLSAGYGEQTYDWAARTGAGGYLPSGVYVLELETAGATRRQRFAIVR